MPPRRSPRRFTGTLQASRQALTSARQLLFTHGIGELTRLAAAGVRTVGVRGLIRRAAAVRQLREDDARYRRWLETHGPGPSDLERLAGQVRSLPVQPLISIITPVFDTDGAWLRRCVDSVRQQIYPIWELCLWDDGSTRAETIDALRTFEGDPRIKIGRGRTNTGIAAASNAALSLATGAFAGFLDHDDELSPDALAEVMRVLADQPGLDILYSDEDKTDAAGERCHPHFKPDWSPELIRACMYTSHFTVMRRQLVLDLGGFRSVYDGAQDYDLMLRAVERTSRIAHVPKVLYHWRMAAGSAASSRLAKPWAISAGRRALEDHLRRTGLDAQVQQAQVASHFRVKYTIRGSPTVSLLLPCASGPAQDAAAPSRVVRALARTGSIRLLDVLVVCHGELPASWRTALGEIPHLVVEAPAGRATTPAALNRAAGHASGEYLMTLDPGLQLLEADWLETLVALSQLEAIGAVGPVLLQADGTVDSAGIVVGCGADGAAGAFHGAPRWTWGHVANALHTRDCTAVDTACLMTKRAVFERVNGFDETFDGALLAVDYGLRLREAGFRVLVSPVRACALGLTAPDACNGRRRATAGTGAVAALARRRSVLQPEFRPRGGEFPAPVSLRCQPSDVTSGTAMSRVASSVSTACTSSLMVESVGHWMSLPTVSVLILNYNGREHLATCLPTLKAQVYPRDRVRVEVIDNGSADGSAEFVRTRHPEVVWHQLDRNYGFAQPYDAAARSGTSQYVAFLNNDTRVEPTWLAELVSAAERHDAQCVASKILDWDGKRIDFVGGLVSYLGHCWQRQHGELTTAGEEADEEGRRLLFACGGSMLISRAAYFDAGGFDKDFFAYFEDVDLGWRLSMLGYRTVLAPRAVTYHRLHGTASKMAFAQRLRLYERNALAMLYKNYEPETLRRVLPSAIVLSLLRGLGHSDIDPKAFGFGATHAGHAPVSARTVVHLLALEDFCRQLPALDRKRAAIQGRRRVADRELVALFGEPFRLHEAGRYEDVARTLIRDFDLESIFARARSSSANAATAPPARVPRPISGPKPGAAVREWPLVSVVILTALGPTHLRECLPSLRAQTYPADRLEIIIVDNGSAEDPTPFVLEQCPGARVIRNGTNLGFAVANNIGAAAANGAYVAFLNDDTRVHPDWLRELVGTAARRQAACVASRILTWDGRRIDFAGGSVNFEGKGFQLETGALEAGRHTEERLLLFACGGALLVDREIFLEQGGWDEGTFAYYEDVELGWRFWLLGHEVWFSPRSVVFHRHHGTSGRWAEPPRRRLYERNSLRMLYALLERDSLERVLPAALLLSADRVLLASHVSRVADHSAPSPDLSPARPPRSLLRAVKERTKAVLRAQGVSRRHSLAQNLRQIGVRGLFGIAQQVAQDSVPMSGAHRTHYDVERGAAPLALDGESEAMPIEAVAALAGLREFIEDLPALSARRARLQASRRRTDREILSRFGEHWTSPVGAAHQLEHEAFHRTLLDSLAIQGLIEAATAVGDGCP